MSEPSEEAPMAAGDKGGDIPDVLGTANRVNMVVASLTNLQQQRMDLQLRQQAEGHSDTDPSGHNKPNGDAITYTERHAALDASERRVASSNSELMEKVRELVAQRDK